ncbi:MAG: hypothetical protein VR72_00295 [Clostridiaceae bacterium BRH_c20a]|nr:MAG: hypothetical protein VR72_00295 [Clostridiaceae bacterium BRH_c20a]
MWIKRKVSAKILSIFLCFTILISGLIAPAGVYADFSQPTTLPPLFDPYQLTGQTGWGNMLPAIGKNLPDPYSVVPQIPKPDLSSLNKNNEDTGEVEPVNGVMVLSRVDLSYPSVGFGPSITRSYLHQEGIKGLLGYSWNIAYDQRLEMYQDFEMVEYRGDGNHRRYQFTKDDPDTLW